MKRKNGQTAVEYLILLGAVSSIVLIALNSDIMDMQETGNIYVDRVTEGLVGAPPKCGDCICSDKETALKCPVDCTEDGSPPPCR